jgi:hypothetical protein
MSYDNLYLVNGAVVNENLRGQPHALYIEDAIQETTVLTGGISAEFGRFTGGVVSAITKSGGNDFSGSVRDTLDNPKWTAKSFAAQDPPPDHTNNTYEETLGGRVIRDRLWFFVAGRQAKVSAARTLVAVSTLPNPAIGAYTISTSSPRQEYKVTANLTQKHSIVGSYLTNNVKGDKNCQIGCLDLRSINTAGVENPNNFKTLHYNGVITNNFLIEGDWAKKYFAFVGFGGSTPAHQANPSAAYLATGSPLIDQVVTGATANAPYFCGSAQQRGVGGQGPLLPRHQIARHAQHGRRLRRLGGTATLEQLPVADRLPLRRPRQRAQADARRHRADLPQGSGQRKC